MENMLCPEVIGRSAELTALTAALDAADEGHGGVVFVTGDDGVGKTRLTKVLGAQAADRGFEVLTGRSTRSAVPVPYRPVAEALLGAARAGIVPDTPDMPVISNYRAALGSLVPEWRRPGDDTAHVTPMVIGEALLRILARPGGPGGLVVLEDLHCADPETLAIVEYLADNIATARVVCVATLRTSEPSACLDLVHALTARRGATRVDVPRLAPDDVAAMAAVCLSADVTPPGVDTLLADCDGLPYAVEEILAAAVSSGELVRDESGWRVDGHVSTRVPDSIAGSVRTRLAALGPAARDIIVTAAILGRRFDWGLLPCVTGVGQAEVLDALQRACQAQLIAPLTTDPNAFRFRHSLTRDAILSDLMPPELASMAAAAAGCIESAHPGLPGPWCELVAELRTLASQRAEAARLLVTVARRALRQGAVSSAVAALENAKKLIAETSAADPMLGIEADEVLLEAFADAGDPKRLVPLARDLLGRLSAAGAEPRRSALVRLRAASACPENNPAAAAAHLAAAADIARELRDPELAARIDAVAAQNALAEQDIDRAVGLAQRALATAEDAGLAGWAAEVALKSLEVAGRANRIRDIGAARAAFERSRQIADDHEDLGIWRIRARHELATLDMLADGSMTGLREALRLARDAGASCVGTIIELQLANLWSLSADLEQALVTARQGERSAAQINAPGMQAVAICLQANIAGVRGDRQQADAAAERAEALIPGDPEIQAATWGQARLLAALFRDDRPRAMQADAAAAPHVSAALATRHGYSPPLGYSALQVPLLSPRRVLALHALVQVAYGRDGAGAIEQARAAGADVSWNAGCLAYAEAMLAGRAGDTSRASLLAEQGAEHFAPFAPWWNHLARRLVATAAFEDGWGQPAEWMRDAASAFEASSYDQLASACRGVLRRAGERVSRRGRGSAHVPAQLRTLGITSREMDVLLLVAGGYSNAEIADKLCISPKTVETHVAGLIGKTGRSGRRELVAHAARLAPS
jgi:DNA-binding CsgD family transcriptional regulator